MKRRFSIISACDTTGDTFSCTAVNSITETTLTCIGHTAVAGDYIVLQGSWWGSAEGTIVKVQSVASGVIIIELMGVTEGVSTDADVVLLNGARTVAPLNFGNTSYVYEKDRVQPFFIKRLNGKLRFWQRNGDFEYLTTYVLANRCCAALFVIERRCGGEWVEEFKGVFTHADVDWDMSHCTADVDIQPYNIYSCLDANKSDKVNYLPVIQKETVQIVPDIYIEYQTCCDTNVTINNSMQVHSPCKNINVNIFAEIIGFDAPCDAVSANFETWALDQAVLTNISGTSDGFGNITTATADVCITFKREFIVTLDNGGDPAPPAVGLGGSWVNIGSTSVGDAPATKWARPPAGCVNYNGLPTAYISDPGIIGISCTADDNLTLTYDCYTEPDAIDYDYGRKFEDVVQYVVRQTCSRVAGVRSDFLEINAPGDTPGYSAGVNYVTGDDNKLANLLIFQKSDFLNPTADESATIGEVSFEDLTNWLRNMFNAYWFIDEDNYLRIEHYSWFTRTATLDVNVTAHHNDKINRGFNRYKFDKDSVPVREEFTWMEANGIDFYGLPIKYSGNCANKDRVDRFDVTNVTTDVGMMLNLPDQIDLEGFAIIARDPNDLTQIDKEAGLITGVLFNNGHLSWANLHYNYFRHGRPLITGTMNGDAETFLSAQRKMKGIQARYAGMCCGAFNPLTDMVTTEIGDGQVDKLTIYNNDNLYQFELLYE